MEKTTIITITLLLSFIIIAILINKKGSKTSLDFKSKIRLLPYWVKFLGIAVTLFSLTIRWIEDLGNKIILENFWQFGIAIGLLLICLSKEKTEDEMLIQVRLNSVFISFFSGILAHIIFVLIDLLMGNTIESFTSLYLISFMLIIYLIYFQISKRKLSK